MKLAFDQTSDFSGKELYSMFSGVDLPEYVKTAEVEDAHDIGQLPKAAFADPDRGIYPINSPSRVYVSNAYFMNKRAAIVALYGEGYASQLETQIKEAAEVFGISEDLQSFESSLNVKQASEYGTAYMVDFVVPGMEAIQMYPVKTAVDLTSAAEAFTKNISMFPFDVRVKSAETFVKTAGELGVDELPDVLCKYAGMFYPDFATLEQEIWRRSTKLASETNKEIYTKLAEDAKNMTSISDVMKLAEALFHVENTEGLYEKTAVAKILGDPVDSIFTVPVTKVAEDLSFIEVHGEKYKTADLSKISKARYEEAFGFEIDPEDTEKLAEVLPTMPRSDMQLFRELSGVRSI